MLQRRQALELIHNAVLGSGKGAEWMVVATERAELRLHRNPFTAANTGPFRLSHGCAVFVVHDLRVCMDSSIIKCCPRLTVILSSS